MTHQDRRTFVVVANVLLFHVVLLWAFQSGLVKQAVQLVVPVQMLGGFIEPPPPALAPPAPPVVVKQSVVRPKAPKAPTLPQPLAVQKEAVTLQTSVMPAEPLAPLSVTTAAVVQAAPAAAPAPLASPSVELPSSAADYLQNPKPVYPSASRRLGEQGVVIHSVQIGADGLPVSAKLVQSSGFHRLDQAALTAVMRWRYSPGKRNGAPTAMSFNVPINWVLE